MWLLLCSIPASAQKKEINTSPPEEKVTVRREYDEQGNLLRFDSLRVFRWSTDSLLNLRPGEGWEKFFPRDFFSQMPGHPFSGDSLFVFPAPFDRLPFSFFHEDELFPGFGNLPGDSARNFIFHNDTSFFMGPHSSFMLPPGFFIPGQEGIDDIRELLEHHFKSFDFGEFPPGLGEPPAPFQRFLDPDQQKEWEELIKKQEKEMQEFRDKWEKKKPTPGLEKM